MADPVSSPVLYSVPREGEGALALMARPRDGEGLVADVAALVAAAATDPRRAGVAVTGPARRPQPSLACWPAAAVRVDLPAARGIGGIATCDDVMEFLVAGASAVQLGTVNFYNPSAAMEVLDALPAAVAELGASSVREIVGTLQTSHQPPATNH